MFDPVAIHLLASLSEPGSVMSFSLVFKDTYSAQPPTKLAGLVRQTSATGFRLKQCLAVHLLDLNYRPCSWLGIDAAAIPRVRGKVLAALRTY